MSVPAIIGYLRLPLKLASLLVIVVFALLLAIAQRAGMLGLPLLLILVSWFFKYSFVLLDHVIDGRNEPPVLSAEMVNPVEQRPFGLLLLMATFYFLTMSLESTVGETAVRLIRLCALAIVPAMAASMSITGRFFSALNPIAVFGTIARIPRAYAAVLVTIALLWLIPWSVLRLLGLYEVVPTIFLLALWMYLWLAMLACIGGVMYEHREELDIEPVVTPERTAQRENANLNRERDRIMDAIFAQCRSGAFTNAGATIRSLVEGAQEPLEVCRWLYERATAWPDQRPAIYIAQLFLPRLLAARATGEALTVVRSRLQRDADFRPILGGQVVELAALARDAGDRATARLLLADFEQRFPNDPACHLATQLSAQVLR
jgi:hypothetical protein